MTMTTDQPATPFSPGKAAGELFADLADHYAQFPHLCAVTAQAAIAPLFGHHIQLRAADVKPDLVAWADSLWITEFIVNRYRSGSTWLTFTAEFARSRAHVICGAAWLDHSPVESGSRVHVGELR